MSLSFEDMETRIYTTLAFPRHQVMTPSTSVTRKNGLMQQSKYQDQRKDSPSNPSTPLPTIYFAFIKTLYLQHARHKKTDKV